jgi:hypothetical protein
MSKQTTENTTKLGHMSLNTEKLNSEEVKSFFCLNWSTTKAGLEIMKDLIKNPIIKLVVSGLIDIGDLIHTFVCLDK